MRQLKHSAEIHRALPEVYRLARQVERYPDFLPGYLESRVQQIDGTRLLLSRKAVVRGKVHAWKSWVRFQENDAIDFEHAAGLLKGMQVHWQFSRLGPANTRLEITHLLKIPRLLGLGTLFETWYAAPRVDGIAAEVVRAFKTACERAEDILS